VRRTSWSSSSSKWCSDNAVELSHAPTDLALRKSSGTDTDWPIRSGLASESPNGSSAFDVLTHQRFDTFRLWQVTGSAYGGGTSPGDGVFVPVSSVCPLTRPNRMTVSLGPRAEGTGCPLRVLKTSVNRPGFYRGSV
jgi:hypothetical protein